MVSLLRKIVGASAEEVAEKLRPIAAKINAMESSVQQRSDDQLRAKTDEVKSRLQQGETLDDLLVEAFAVVRETAKRCLGQRHYDVQLIGGVVLHRGMSA